MAKFRKITIIGMGLIGGSLGKALIEKAIADEVVGVCRRQSSLDRAVKEGTLTTGFVESYAEALPGSDIIVIATPVHTIKEVLGKLTKKDVGRAVVTDVGSTKKEITEFAASLGEEFTFIGSHPLAGSEKTGPENAREGLFDDSVCFITPDEDADKAGAAELQEMWESVGARVFSVSAGEHDRHLAFSSHLPHVVAYALACSKGKDIPKEVFASGFKDTTRIASSDPSLWSDIFLSNGNNVLDALESFRQTLSRIEEAIRAGKEEDLKKILEDCRKSRDELV